MDRKRIWLLITGLVILTLSGCGGGGGGSSAKALSLELVSLSPADGATDIALDTSLVATLSQEIDCNPIPAAPLLLVDGAQNEVTGTVSCNGDTLTFTPDSTLVYSTSYSATLQAGITSLDGTALQLPTSWSFTTLANLTAPTVNSNTPAEGATGVAATTAVSASFNEDIYAVTVDGSSFTLSGNSAVSGTVDFDGATNVATFTPDSDLALAATYTATLTTGITDLYGNGLASDNSWSFTTADGSWGSPELIENNANHVSTPTVAFDNNGNAFALWPQSDGIANSLWASRYEPGSGWGTAELIESNAGIADRADIAFDNAGNAIAVWPQHDGTRFNMWANRYVLGSGWQTAEKIETDDSGTAHSPKVDFDGSGNALVVWHQTDGVRYNIMANRYVAGSGWGTAEIIDSEDLGDALFPTIAVSDTGDAIAVWEQYDGVRYNIWRNHYTNGSGWQTAEKLESDDVTYARYPQIGTDGDGNAIVVWNQGTDIMASHYQSGSGWSTPALIETESSTFYYPHIAMNSSGKAVVVWYDSGTTDSIWANSYDLGSGWGTAQRIENDGVALNYDPRIAIDEEGNAIAVWQLENGADYSIMSNRYTVNGGWGTAETIETISAECYEPTIAIDSSSGKGIAVWYDYDTTHDLFVNRFE